MAVVDAPPAAAVVVAGDAEEDAVAAVAGLTVLWLSDAPAAEVCGGALDADDASPRSCRLSDIQSVV